MPSYNISLLRSDEPAGGSVRTVFLLLCRRTSETAAVDYELLSAPLSSRWKHRRTLAWLLLAIVAYGAVLEIVHSHGQVQSTNSSLAAFSESGDGSGSPQNYSAQNQCSTCQFQRQLFGGYLDSTPFTRAPVTEFVFEPPPSVLYISALTTRHSGRAPPTN